MIGIQFFCETNVILSTFYYEVSKNELLAASCRQVKIPAFSPEKNVFIQVDIFYTECVLPMTITKKGG